MIRNDLVPQELCMELNDQTFEDIEFSLSDPFNTKWGFRSDFIIKSGGEKLAKLTRNGYISNPQWEFKKYKSGSGYPYNVCDLGCFRLNAPGLAAKLLNLIEPEVEGILRKAASDHLGILLAKRLAGELATMYNTDISRVHVKNDDLSFARVVTQSRVFKADIGLETRKKGLDRILSYNHQRKEVSIGEISTLSSLIARIEHTENEIKNQFK